ncbi:MAG: cyclic nucleotide-binding domain-containing protein [Sorangiineae bacterium]|nr:cyclic nucleotide-binding domain-containing protein [Polyangiaceae bacterium]MEB2323282.1 cyclic nucleotide-binding domain-containing protein [Sorangiineae bacterium]
MSTASELAAALEDSPSLAGLTAAGRAALAALLEPVTVPRGDAIVSEGASDRAMYFVVSGHGRLVRGDVRIGGVHRGDHFGELALIAKRPRAASIIAESELELGRLSVERYMELSAGAPELALELLQALLGSVADRLVEVTEGMTTLLSERSLPRRSMIAVRLGGETRRVHMGTRAGTLLPSSVEGSPVVAALVDLKAASLSTPLSSDCRLEPLTTAHWEGQRVYRQSLGLLLLEAARRVEPTLRLRLGASVGFAQKVELAQSSGLELVELARALEQAMHELVDSDRPLSEEWWTVDEAREHFEAAGWGDAVRLLATWRDPAVPLASYGEVFAISLSPLVSRTGALAELALVPDDSGLLLVYGPRASTRHPPPYVSESLAPPAPGRVSAGAEAARAISRQTTLMVTAQELWLDTLGVTSVGAFNTACIDGDVAELIRVSEGFQEKRISRIADRIHELGDRVKVITIAGPSSSGKTTFIKRLRVQLQVVGKNPIGLSLDDYYVDRELNPRDADGDYDYESFDALRSELLAEHLERLLSGARVRTARYDFESGRSSPEGGDELALEARDLLMLEGIHGLNPRLLGTVEPERVFRIFICPLAQLPFDALTRVHASDVRLIRRIVRDRHTRGSRAADNIQRWPSVRKGEREHIFPFQRNADAVFDSSLLYELGVLKVFAERYLLEVPQDTAAWGTAFRLLQLLDRFVTIYPDHVPPTSILREFIGGSGFEY